MVAYFLFDGFEQHYPAFMFYAKKQFQFNFKAKTEAIKMGNVQFKALLAVLNTNKKIKGEPLNS